MKEIKSKLIESLDWANKNTMNMKLSQQLMNIDMRIDTLLVTPINE